ncbi:TadE/TadG family type IV pilus assembly protein [Vibrio pelagius]|uniref:TadE/TadG family type IV pilus assembly protein n=1 Tax=Vibrio pelagius TaxID=28169 RepID=UPI0021C3DD26|nr:TadE family protein [Vibrio pelagius]
MANYTLSKLMFKKRRRQNGVVSIEFALGFFAFWLFIAAWVEVCFLSYVSATTDLAIANASREAKKDNSTYLASFKKVLDTSDSVWSNFVDSSKVSSSVHYVKTMAELHSVADVCTPSVGAGATCGVEQDSSIAIYHLRYEVGGVFTYFFDNTTLLSREVIVVQEYERDKFEI